MNTSKVKISFYFLGLLEENLKIFLFLLAFFHIYMKKDLEAKPDLPYICAANRALIYCNCSIKKRL
jgi:hypothetical protein